MSHIRSISQQSVVYEEASSYRGLDGMKKFRACAGLGRPAPGRTELLQLKLGITLPASLADLVEEGGFISRWANFCDVVERVGLLRDVGKDHLKYLHLVSRKLRDSDYVWNESALFREKYHQRSGLDGCTFASPEWFPEMLLLGEGRSGELFLANPVVKTSDGEWEGWLWSHRCPGAYRFSSIAELLGHCYLESRNKTGDCPRFGRETFNGSCAQHLVHETHV